jgi:thioredoxin reductase (NADPH)
MGRPIESVPTLTAAALGEVEALVIPAPGLRALMIEEADLGERIMQTSMLRRVHPLEGDAGVVVLIGPPDLGDTVRLQNFFARLSFPCHTLDPLNDRLAADVVER